MKINQRPVFLYPRKIARSRRPVRCRGQTLVEYALILAVISIVSIGVLINLSKGLGSLYSTIDSQVQRAPGGVNSGG
jgi:Flp pilus assembly pilin Flp